MTKQSKDTLAALASADKTLTATLKAVFKRTVKETAQESSDIGLIALNVKAHMDAVEAEAKANGTKYQAFALDTLQTLCYNLADYDPKAQGKNTKFQMRVMRGIRSALLAHVQFNPLTGKQGDATHGYALDDTGAAVLPTEVVFPTHDEKDKDGNTVKDVKTHDMSPLLMGARPVTAHFGAAFPGSVEKRATRTTKANESKDEAPTCASQGIELVYNLLNDIAHGTYTAKAAMSEDDAGKLLAITDFLITDSVADQLIDRAPVGTLVKSA